jgi:hypothetical protein
MLGKWTVSQLKVQLILRSLQLSPGAQCHRIEVALSIDAAAAKQLGFIGAFPFLRSRLCLFC